MTLRLANENRVWVKKVEDKGKYGVLTVSTSRLDKRDNTRYYSTFYVRLVGSKSYDRISELMERYLDGEKFDNSGMLKKGFAINITSANLSNEPYEKEGKKVYQNMQLTCWEWEWLSDDERASQKASSGKQDDSEDFDSDDEFPF